MDPEPALSIVTNLDLWLLLSIVIFFLLLMLSALISGSEVAFFSLSENDIYKASESKINKEKAVVQLLRNPQKLLATILISNNFVNILIVLIFAYIGETIFASISAVFIKFLVELILVTFLILMFGEVLPKVYATRNAMKFAAFMAVPFKILNSALSVISLPLMNLTNIVEKKLNKKLSLIHISEPTLSLIHISEPTRLC